MAGVPLGDVLVNDVTAVNISGSDCLTASLWITGVDGVLHVVTVECYYKIYIIATACYCHQTLLSGSE